MPIVGLDTQLLYKATAADTLAVPGRVESADLDGEQTAEHLTGAAGDDSVVMSMIEPKGSASLWVQSTALLAKAIKTVVNALPPEIAEIQGGAVGEDMSKQTQCYIDVLEFSLEKGGALKADIEWLALTHTTGDATVTATALAKNLIMEWHAAEVELGAATYGCQSVKVRNENGLALDTDLDEKTAGVERQPVSILPGNSKVSIDVEFNASPDVDVWVANPATVQLVVAVANTEDKPKTLTITATNLHPVSKPNKVSQGEDKVTYQFQAEADYNDLTALTFMLA